MLQDNAPTKESRGIEKASNRLEKAMCVLQESVSSIERSFRPVLRNVPQGVAEKGNKGISAECDFESMISRFENGVLEIAENLNEFARRSAV